MPVMKVNTIYNPLLNLYTRTLINAYKYFSKDIKYISLKKQQIKETYKIKNY